MVPKLCMAFTTPRLEYLQLKEEKNGLFFSSQKLSESLKITQMWFQRDVCFQFEVRLPGVLRRSL